MFYQISDILTELQNCITICNVMAHLSIKGNEGADKKSRKTIGMPEIVTTKLPYVGH